jgi:CheY-like chemotaxis protein
MKSDHRPLDLNHEVTYTAQMWQQSLPKMIETRITLGDDLWLIDGDPSQLQQVLLNLATNAADAMPDGGTISIETGNILIDSDYCREHREATPGKHVFLKVSDTGSGMSPETIERIFEPFFTTKEVGKGTGLGLASTYGIVAAHHGHLRCESELGRGTTFSIYLPATIKVRNAETEVEKSPLTIKGSETLLFIDDEKMIQEMAYDFFTALGYRVLIAASGEEALDILAKEKNTINMAILDMNMPGMGGYRCLLAIRKLYAGIPVLIASGYSDHGPVQDTLNLGAQGYIGKPFTMEKLAAHIRSILDRS